MRVEAYYNLTKNCWSVRALEGPDKGKVFMYAESLAIEDAQFVVREGGRQQVLRDKQKNVHAFVRGSLVTRRFARVAQRLLFGATYNPYRYDSFVNRSTEDPVFSASLVHMHADRKVTYIP